MNNHSHTPEREDLIALGKITRTQGSAGAVRLLPFFSPLNRIEELKSHRVFLELVAHRPARAPLRPATIKSIRYHKQFVIVEFLGVSDMTEAEQLRDAIVYTTAEQLWELEEGQFFAFQLVGLSVVQEGPTPLLLGRVVAVDDGAAHDYLRVANESKEFLIPFVEAMIRKVDLGEGVIFVDLPEGLMDL